MYLSQKLNFLTKKRENTRYNNSFQPRFIENMYRSGGMFHFEMPKGGIYKSQIDRIKENSDNLKSQVYSHKEGLRNLYYQEEDFKLDMKKEYNKVKRDLQNYANDIEDSIRIGFNNQKKENMKIKEQLLNIKNGHYELSKLIRDVKESIEKIKNKIGEF